MTNEEAKIIIGNILIKPEALDDCYDITEYQEAKAMAIKALDQQPCKDCFTDEEKRIFLASVAREMRVCEVIDSEKTKVKLVPILERVKDKVLRSSLWKGVEE